MTLEQLEQRTRRLTIGMITLFCGLAVVVGFNVTIAFSKLGQIRAEIARLRASVTTGIQSQQFQLVDEQGEVRGSLASRDGRSVLVLSDRQGRPRIVADAGDPAPRLELFDESGRTTVSLLLDPAGNSVLVRSPNGESHSAIHAVVGATGPRVRLLGDEGQEVGLVP